MGSASIQRERGGVLRPSSLVILTVLVTSAPVTAHGLGIETSFSDPSTVQIVVFFTDDTPAQKAQVRVFDLDQNEAAAGVTDDNGLWRFRRPAAGVYRIEVNAWGGHRKRTHVTIPESGAIESDDPTRTEFTRFRWQSLVIGLVIILVLALAARALLRRLSLHSKTT